MARPKLNRLISVLPEATYFKPRGLPLTSLKEVRLTVEELEALRLADMEGLDGAEASRLMGVSRHTFGRVLKSARRTVAEALVVGKALCIEGGNWAFNGQTVSECRRAEKICPSCVGFDKKEEKE